MLKARKAKVKSASAFPGDVLDSPILGTPLDHQHDGVRTKLKLPKDFVIHSLRHTMLSRLGESGADSFTMRIAGHRAVVTNLGADASAVRRASPHVFESESSGP